MHAYIYLCKNTIGRLNIGDFIQKSPKFTPRQYFSFKVLPVQKLEKEQRHVYDHKKLDFKTQGATKFKTLKPLVAPLLCLGATA